MVYMHLAQLVEREAFNLVVVGSSPTVRKCIFITASYSNETSSHRHPNLKTFGRQKANS